MQEFKGNPVIPRLEEALRGLSQPHDIEAEREILGAMLLSENALVQGLSMLRADDFYVPAHQKIFQAIFDLYHARQKIPVDYLMVKDELERRGELEAVGGIEYLQDLSVNVLSPALVEQHAQIVREKSIYRALIRRAWETAAEALTEKEPAENLLEKAEQRFLEIRSLQVDRVFQTLEDLKDELLTHIVQTSAQASRVRGMPTGFPDLDRYTLGFHRGDLVVVASRPSVGKTSFVLNVMRHLAVEEGVPVVIFSLEMPAEQLALRFLAMEARVSLQDLRAGKIEPQMVGRLTTALEKLASAPILIDDSSGLSVLDLRTRARRAVVEKGAKVIFVDYLQLLHARGGRTYERNRTQEVSEISRSLKLMAKDLDVPVVALSQLSRAVEQREDKRPRLADLRESGAIEQDADLALFLHRPGMYTPQGESAEGARVDVIVAKNRNGPLGTATLVFQKTYTRFEQISEGIGIGESDLPPLDLYGEEDDVPY